jgi:hypothetical protein
VEDDDDDDDDFEEEIFSSSFSKLQQFFEEEDDSSLLFLLSFRSWCACSHDDDGENIRQRGLDGETRSRARPERNTKLERLSRTFYGFERRRGVQNRRERWEHPVD